MTVLKPSHSGQKTTIGTIFGDIEQLPTLPTVYNRLQNMLSDPKVSARDVGKVIEQDQALAAKIIKVVNSSYYGFPKQVSTISHSVVILGFNELKHMALSVSLLKLFNSKQGNHSFDPRAFWQHSLAVAVCAGTIARKAGHGKCSSHEEAFVAGLLHDIGKIIEDQYMQELFSKVIDLCSREQVLIYEAEKRLLGITHQDIGGFLAKKWRLPPVLESAILYHHTPMSKRSDPVLFSMLAIIHCADILVRGMGIGSGGDPFVPPLQSECWKELGLPVSCIKEIVEETTGIFNEISKLLLE
jgi:putative nucleotidyltransferase with HDIG domain